jgi:DNA adenine methylase
MANTIIKRVGGKNKIAQWIKDNLPPHDVYCEGFAGSFAVGFGMPKPSGTRYRKVLNDLDGHLCNFFAVLRDQPEELARVIGLSPYSRADFDAAHSYITEDRDFSQDDPVDRARRFVIYNRQSIFGKETDTWCIARKGENVAYTWGNLPSDVISMAKALQGVYVENLDYRELLKKWDSPTTLFYMDPPYLDVEKDFYKVNKQDGFDHEELARQMLSAEGSFAVSYYDSEQIRDLYPGCKFLVKEVVKHMQTSKKDKAKELLIVRENESATRERKRYGIEF